MSSTTMTPGSTTTAPSVKTIVWPSTPDVSPFYNDFLIIIFLMRENDKNSDTNDEDSNNSNKSLFQSIHIYFNVIWDTYTSPTVFWRPLIKRVIWEYSLVESPSPLQWMEPSKNENQLQFFSYSTDFLPK